MEHNIEERRGESTDRRRSGYTDFIEDHPFISMIIFIIIMWVLFAAQGKDFFGPSEYPEYNAQDYSATSY